MGFYFEQLERRTLLAGASSVRFAVLGDYGDAGPAEAAVAQLAKSWNPEYILTVGDNNYPDGEAATIDANVGQYFHEYIYNYQGTYGTGSPTRRFLPALGNHDWHAAGAQPYLDYFDLPGNERYYDVVAGPAHFFILDSDPSEPDGTSSSSAQAQWLQAALAASGSDHKVVLLHHAPYSSGHHGSSGYAQWPFRQWGASAVVAGHDHDYERLNIGGLPYFVNGLGGRSIRDFGPTVVPGSEMRFNGDYGAMLGEADGSHLRFQFFTRAGQLIDTYTIAAADAPQVATVTVFATDSSAGEGDDGDGEAMVTFARTGDTSGTLTVEYQLAGSAGNGTDYGPLSGEVTFVEGAATATVVIDPIDDGIIEGEETVEVTLSLSDAYNRGADYSAAATIADDDGTVAVLVPAGSVWRYRDTGTAPPAGWREPGFDDGGWKSGPAQLGYGEGDETTVIAGGPQGSRFIAHHFRRSFEMTEPARARQLEIGLLRDDGAVLYLNGTEIWRHNMPDGPVNHQTRAIDVVGGDAEDRFFEHVIAAPLPVFAGTNVLAVELHQSGPLTSDASFDLKLVAMVDDAAPPAPSRPDLADASDSGISSADDITNVVTPVFTGTAEPASLVRLFADGIEIGSDRAASDGSYLITSAKLAEGSRIVTATAEDDAGNVSPPSQPLAVTLDTTAPTVSWTEFLFDGSPMSLAYLFDEAVDPTFSLTDLVVENLTEPSVMDPSAMELAFGDATIWLRFPGLERGILPDGDWRATVLAAGVTDAAGNAMAADAVFEFCFFQGDANRDRIVNLIDFNILASNFGESGRVFSQGDFSYDGSVDLIDFNLLAARFGTGVGVGSCTWRAAFVGSRSDPEDGSAEELLEI